MPNFRSYLGGVPQTPKLASTLASYISVPSTFEASDPAKTTSPNQLWLEFGC